MIDRNLLSTILLCLTAAVLAACDGGSSSEQPRSQASSGATKALTAPVQKETGEDAELTARVKQALVSEAAVSEDIEVRSNAGVVLLKGRVASDDEKKRIMAAAQKVQGVKWVQNQVAVTPPAAPATPRSAPPSAAPSAPPAAAPSAPPAAAPAAPPAATPAAPDPK